MSKPFISKDQAPDYARWAPASFEAKSEVGQSEAQLKEEEDRLRILREAARQEGFAAGLSEGRAQGLAEGRQGAERERECMRQLCANLSTALAAADETISQELLDLALDFAQAMLKVALPVRPELLLPIVKEAVHYLPSVRPPAQLFLHAEDVALIREHLGEELELAGWRILEDKTLERGDCRIETASNQIDATLVTRWHRLAAALGKKGNWLK